MRIISSQSFFLYAARPTVISTVDSGAEKSPVSMAPVPPLPLSFRSQRSKAEWSGETSGPNGTSASPSHCHFDRNGAKRSGVEKSPAPCCRPIAMGDLSTQSNNRFQTPLPSYRHAAPLEMTCRRPALQSWETETNDTDTPSHCHFDRNGAKRSGVEKSPAPMLQTHCGGRSRGSKPQWSSNIFTFLPTRSPARDDRAASHCFGNFKA